MKDLGFTLVEVIVAVLVLEVGLLGVVGTLWLAALTLTRAERTERGVAEMEFVYDSLATLDRPASGVREGVMGTLRWWVRGPDLRVEYAAGGDSALVSLEARTSAGGGE